MKVMVKSEQKTVRLYFQEGQVFRTAKIYEKTKAIRLHPAAR